MEQSFESWCNENHSELLSEYHPKKNIHKPSEIKPKSNSKVWWLGKCGHEWEAPPYSRINGNGCPYCSNHKVLKNYNDLAYKYPDLASQWHPIKNNSLTPDQVLPGSKKRVWWLGKCGHEWDSSICDRTTKQLGCPYCSGKRVLRYFNDLETIDPDLASEWHPTKNSLKPYEVAPHSNKKVWWLGKCGHEWEALVANRIKGVGCPFCNGTSSVLPGLNDLETIDPDLASEWHPSKNSMKPSEVRPQSNKKVWWLGKCGHEWEATVDHRYSRGHGCPYCSGQRVLAEETSLQAINPQLAELWDYEKNSKTPSEVSMGCGEKFHWNCKCGHKRFTTISSMIKNQCPTCTREMRTSFQEKAIAFYLEQIIQIQENYRPPFLKRGELDIFIPLLQIAIEYDGRKGHTEDKLPSDIRKNQLCADNQIRLIRIREKECPPISGEVIIVRNKSDQDLENAIRSILNTVCNELGCNLEVTVDLAKDSGVIQAKQYSKFKEKSIKATFPEIACEFHPTKNGDLNPEYVPAYGNRKVWWLGKCGHEWEAAPNTRARGDGCPYCSGVKVLKGFNDLQTRNPELSLEWHPTKNEKLPSDYSYGSGIKVWWLGKCGHEWEAAINHRFNGERCPYCNGTTIVLRGLNDLETVDPKLTSEWHPTKNDVKPSEIRPQSNKKVWWLCKNGHEWQATVSHRYSRGDGCPYCSGRKTLKGFNDLLSKYPLLCLEWSDKNSDNPSQYSPNSCKEVIWKCEKGHEWSSPIRNRTIYKSGCPYCSGRKVIKGYNDLETTDPEIASHWHPKNKLMPSEVSRGSGKKVWWIDSEGHEFEGVIQNIVKRKQL